MGTVQGSGPQYPCVFHINQAWQLAIGRLARRGLDVRELGGIFDAVPRPRSYAGAVLAAYALNTFFLDFGRAYDGHFHRVVCTAHCTFDPAHCYEYVRVNPDTWRGTDVAGTVRRWVAAFHAAFAAAHRRDVPTLGIERVMGGEGTVHGTARDLRCSAATFRRRFKAKTGMRPIDARTRARVIEAFVRLRTSTDKIDVIRSEVGWRSPKAIYQAFEGELHMTPRAVRQLSNTDAAAIFEPLGGDPARLGWSSDEREHTDGPKRLTPALVAGVSSEIAEVDDVRERA